MTVLVPGATAGGDAIWGIAGTNSKLEGKAGNDQLIGSNGDDLILGGHGSDVLFGGAGEDTFVFDKFAKAGDVDFVDDFKFGVDSLKFGEGVTILGASASLKGAGIDFNGIDLHNDAKAYDLKLTLQIVDGDKTFTQEVYLVDALKNAGWHADDFEAYLKGINHGEAVDIQFA